MNIKNIFFTLIFLFLVISCSKDETKVSIIKEKSLKEIKQLSYYLSLKEQFEYFDSVISKTFVYQN